MFRRLLPLLMLSLAGCSQKSALDLVVSPVERVAVERDIRRMHALDLEAERAGVSRSGPARMLPRDPTVSLALVDARSSVSTRTGRRRTLLAYQVSGARDHLLVVVRSGGAQPRPTYQFIRLAGPLERINAFTAPGKRPIHLLFAAVMAGALGTSLWALWVLWRQPLFPRRWLWAVGSLFGLGRVTIDWTSGALGINPFSVQLPTAMIGRVGLLGPWMLTFGLPVVAIMVLVLHHRRARSTVAD